MAAVHAPRSTAPSLAAATRLFCATADPVDVLVAATRRGRAIVGVVDGAAPPSVETAAEGADRHRLLRDPG